MSISHEVDGVTAWACTPADLIPKPAAAALVGMLVDLLVETHASVLLPDDTTEPMLLVAVDATCFVVRLRDGRLVAIPWSRAWVLRGRERACRECGCTDLRACADGCGWAEIDLCTACIERAEWEAEQAAEGAA